MKKNILIISSSPRKGGNSDLLSDEFKQGALESGNHVEKIRLSDKHINYCRGCGICYKASKPCPQKDDMVEILDRMLAADVIVLATPVYFYSMSGQMKTFIDRTVARYEELKNKEFYFILAAAETEKPAMERTVEGFRGFLDCLDGAVEKGTIYGLNAWQAGEIKSTPAMAEARKMGAAV